MDGSLGLLQAAEHASVAGQVMEDGLSSEQQHGHTDVEEAAPSTLQPRSSAPGQMAGAGALTQAAEPHFGIEDASATAVVLQDTGAAPAGHMPLAYGVDMPAAQVTPQSETTMVMQQMQQQHGMAALAQAAQQAAAQEQAAAGASVPQAYGMSADVHALVKQEADVQHAQGLPLPLPQQPQDMLLQPQEQQQPSQQAPLPSPQQPQQGNSMQVAQPEQLPHESAAGCPGPLQAAQAATQPQVQPQPPRAVRRTVYSSLQSLGGDVHIASPSLPVVKHRSKKHATIVLSPAHLIHVPRTFLQEHYDIESVLKNGLKVQIDADGTLDPDVVHTTVANYQNKSGYSYHRLLGFKPVCRKYLNWRVVGWQAVDHETVRLCISKPAPAPPNSPPPAAGVEGGSDADNSQLGGDAPARPAKRNRGSGKGGSSNSRFDVVQGSISGGGHLPGWLPGLQLPTDRMVGSGQGFLPAMEDGGIMYSVAAGQEGGMHNSNNVLLSALPIQSVGGGMFAWLPDQVIGDQQQRIVQVPQDWQQSQQQQLLQQHTPRSTEVGTAQPGPYQVLDQAGVQQLLAQHLQQPQQQPAQGSQMRPPTLLESLKQAQQQQQGLMSGPMGQQQQQRGSNGLAPGQLQAALAQPQQQQQQQLVVPAPGTACLARASCGTPVALMHTHEGVVALPIVQPGTNTPTATTISFTQPQQMQLQMPQAQQPQVQQVAQPQLQQMPQTQAQQVQQVHPGLQQVQQFGPVQATYQLLDSSGNHAVQQQQMSPTPTQQQAQQAHLPLQQLQVQQAQLQLPQQQVQLQQAQLQQLQQQQQVNMVSQPVLLNLVGPNGNLTLASSNPPTVVAHDPQLQQGATQMPQLLSQQAGPATYSLAFSSFPPNGTATMQLQGAPTATTPAAAAALQLRVAAGQPQLLLAQAQPGVLGQPQAYDLIYQLPTQQQQQ